MMDWEKKSFLLIGGIVGFLVNVGLSCFDNGGYYIDSLKSMAGRGGFEPPEV